MKKTEKRSAKPGIANYANLIYIRARLEWVTLMERGSGRLGAKGQRVALVLFCLLGTSFCLLPIFGIPSKPTDDPRLQPIRITKITTAVSPGEKPLINDAALKNQLRTIRRYLDSLQNSPSGKATFDSIIAARPGLPDSLTMAEKIINNIKN